MPQGISQFLEDVRGNLRPWNVLAADLKDQNLQPLAFPLGAGLSSSLALLRHIFSSTLFSYPSINGFRRRRTAGLPLRRVWQ